MKWSGREQEWLLDHGLETDEDGRILIPEHKWSNLQYTDRSIFNRKLHTLMIPSDFGCCLITEGMHFIILKEGEGYGSKANDGRTDGAEDRSGDHAEERSVQV